MILTVVASLERHLGLPKEIPILVVCDGCVVHTDSNKPNVFRQGIVTSEHAKLYEEYKENLRASSWGGFTNVSLFELKERSGFGKAVLLGLRELRTPLLLIAQHDWVFNRDENL